MDYLYGNLNKLIELQKYKFTSSDETILTNLDSSNILDLKANTQRLITLKQVKKDTDPIDDQIKYYSLYAYNSDTKDFDIKIGEEIAIGTSIASSVDSAWVKVGEYQKFQPVLDDYGNPILDDNGNPVMEPVLDEDGNPIMVPMYQQVATDISSTGQLMLSQIPISAIIDTTVTFDECGNLKEIPIESTIDANPGGLIY